MFELRRNSRSLLTDEFYCLGEKTGKILSDVIRNGYLHVLDAPLFFECVRQIGRDVQNVLKTERNAISNK